MRVYTYVVVEDEDLLRNSLMKKITNLSLPLKLRGTADNGADGLELIGKVYPDIVLLDIMMPVMDGMEMAEKIHARYPEIKMIIVTGYSDFELARQAIRFGVKEYMLKPIDIKELQDTLLRVLAELKGEDGIADREVRREYVIRQMRAEGSSQNALKEAMVGYPDPCYFSRVFKEQTNQYPKEYRQSQNET